MCGKAGNKANFQTVGKQANCVVCYDLKAPCVYHVYGSKSAMGYNHKQPLFIPNTQEGFLLKTQLPLLI